MATDGHRGGWVRGWVSGWWVETSLLFFNLIILLSTTALSTATLPQLFTLMLWCEVSPHRIFQAATEVEETVPIEIRVGAARVKLKLERLDEDPDDARP